MTDQTNSSDFNVWLALDALQGITEALYQQLTEGPASEMPLDRGTHASLIGLAYAARRLARELNEYFRAASEAGLELPDIIDGKRDDNVRETFPPYHRVN